jgi:osmotically-inducible protein OsmY
LTPLDQGNSPADRNTTAQIRKQIMALDGMSMNAKNVKIITANGKVTLRGPVDSKDEKRQIAKIAGKIAGVKNVDDLLEIKMTDKKAN